MSNLKKTLKNSNITRHNLSNIMQQREEDVDKVLKREKEDSVDSSSIGSYENEYNVEQKDVFSISSESDDE